MSLNNLTIFLNTHSSVADCWPMFFGQLEKHWPNHPPIVVATDHYVPMKEFVEDNNTLNLIIGYHRRRPFGAQYLQGLSYVQTDYVLPLLEDFILIGDVDVAAIEDFVDTLSQDHHLEFVRLIQSGEHYPFSFQASVWRTSALLHLCVEGRAFKTPWEFELGLCASGKVPPGYMLCGKTKRGRDHYDSLVFPYISTALNKGKWNREYEAELTPLLAEYGIDPNRRGWA